MTVEYLKNFADFTKAVGGGVFYIPNPGFPAQFPATSQNDPHAHNQNAFLQAQTIQQQAFSGILKEVIRIM